MPKKKKKGRSIRDDAVNNSVNNRGKRSSSRKKKPLSTPTSKPLSQLDVISLKLLKGTNNSPSATRSIKYSPILLLHESDACMLDIVVGDRVFIISIDSSVAQRIQTLAVARVKIIDGTSVDSSMPISPFVGGTNVSSSNFEKKIKINVGSCYIFPLSLAESFFCSDRDQSFRHNSISMIEPYSIDSSVTTPKKMKECQPKIASSSNGNLLFPEQRGSEQLTASPQQKMTPLSSSNSKFSFAKGGGGDQLISPLTSTKNTTPSSIGSKSGTNKIVQIVPFDSDLGDLLVSMFCKPAKALSVHRYSADNQKQKEMSESFSLESSWTVGLPLCRHLVVAHIADEYLTEGASFSISKGGQTVKYQVATAAHESMSNESMSKTLTLKDKEDHAIIAELERLSIVRNNETVDMSCRNRIENNDLEESLRLILCVMSDDERKALFMFKVNHETEVKLVAGIGTIGPLSAPPERAGSILTQITPPKSMVAGLDKTIKQVKAALEIPLLHSELFKGSIATLKPPKGILLHGPSGIGKSSLALQVGQNFASNGAYHVDHIHCSQLRSQTAFVGQAESRFVKLFTDAQNPRPGKKGCLLILDDIHLICPRREGIDLGADRLASTLLALLDGMKSRGSMTSHTFYPMVILAISTDPGALDPALRRPGRLDTEIEVPLPDEPSIRLKILKFQLNLLGIITNFSDSEWLSLARLAKGFTGADLKLAAKDALRNCLLTNSSERKMTFSLIKTSIMSTTPSAIKAITVEVPSVPWASIGGMDGVKKQLRDAIELPLTHDATFKRLGIRPPRGILLYGPPGCSKTLMARALATEGQMNFLAVKGPELLSKWLGESERALAALFRRARLASPAIIFFDEVDAIASKRGNSSGGERLLSQLLTELDGIQQNKEYRIMIVCATNRPDLLDGALMRPGRIDRMIYVGVPDKRSRESILKIGLQKSCTKNIDISLLANDEISGGLSGAELVGACRDAALKAMEDFEENGNGSTDPIITTEHILTTLTKMERRITAENHQFYASF